MKNIAGRSSLTTFNNGLNVIAFLPSRSATNSYSSTSCGPPITHLFQRQCRPPPSATYNNASHDVNFIVKTKKPPRYASSALVCTIWPSRTHSWTRRSSSRLIYTQKNVFKPTWRTSRRNSRLPILGLLEKAANFQQGTSCPNARKL